MEASRLVVLRERVVTSLQGAFDAWGDAMTSAIDERVQPFLEEGEGPFDFALLQRVLRRMVAASFEHMVAADKAHVDELADDIQPRLERDSWMQRVRQKMIDIRRIATGLFGPQRAVEIVAIDGSTAQEPELLWRQTEHTASRLRSPGLRVPEASTSAVRFEPAGLADELDPLVAGLRGAIHAVEVEERQAAATLQVKQEAMSEHDLLIRACKGILTGFYLLARRPDLADRIRISLPRPTSGSKNGEASSGDQTSGEPSTEEPSGASTDAEPDAERGGAAAD